MVRRSAWGTICCSLLLPLLPLTMLSAVESSFTTDIKPFMETYCVSCHNPEKKKADLDLTIYRDDATAARATKLWRHVIEQVGDHLMPPENAKKQPTMAEREAIVAALKNLKKYDGPPDPGRVTIRRLNRTEYDYTIRDLLGLDLRTARSSFPSDDVGEGFDNIGDVLSLPPLLLEKYLDAATTILDKAIVGQPLFVSYNGAQLPAIQDGKPLPPESGSGPRDFTGPGELIFQVNVPADGKYTLRVRVGQSPAGDKPAMMVIKVDNQVVKELTASDKLSNPPSQSVPLTLQKGSRRITFHFANPYREPDQAKPGDKSGKKPAVRTLSIASLDLTQVATNKVSGRNKRIFIAEPGPDLAPRIAAQKIVEHLASLAFRRPATKEQVDRLLNIFDRVSATGETFDEAIKYTLKAVLVSPYFLYRIETDRPATLANNAYPLDDYELASRLSYFLWSSMPDSELFDLAKQGKLRDPTMLEKQARRMLKDPKAQALAETFGEQWLTLRSLDDIAPDTKKFPDYTRQLKIAMYDEAMMYFGFIMQSDRSILEFIDSNYTFVNERLAKHYGMPDVSGLNMRRVDLKDRKRGGVLTMAAVLTVTSQPGRTSPVKRGKWILEQIVGEPPPPPPPAVPALEEQDKGISASLSLREKMVKHRQDPVCASCHIKMDAIGFGFENYDAIGRWRTTDDGAKLDTAGDLPGGVTFNNAVELKAIFMKRKDDFTRCFTEKMLTFALGRGLMDYDNQVVEDIAAAVAKNDYRFSTLITRIVTSYPFMNRRNP